MKIQNDKEAKELIMKDIVIEKDKVTPEILKQSVVKILTDDNFRINSEIIGKSLREAGGYKKGVDEILNLKN